MIRRAAELGRLTAATDRENGRPRRVAGTVVALVIPKIQDRMR